MRINVYSQELTKEVTLVSATAKDTGIAYMGVRIFLASPDILHHTEQDDDRSAITFWIPNCESFTKDDLVKVFRRMAEIVARGSVDRDYRPPPPPPMPPPPNDGKRGTGKRGTGKRGTGKRGTGKRGAGKRGAGKR